MTDIDELNSQILEAVALEGPRAVLRVAATYAPAGGPGSKIYPPTFPIGANPSPYLMEDRFVDGAARAAVVLDQTPSQANRAEEAVLRAHRSGRVRVPLLELHHTGEAPVVISSLEFPHRYADAYLRDSLQAGVKFDSTDLGKSMIGSSLDDATELYTHDPGSLVYGAWNSHRKGRQQKFPRVYASEIVGWDPEVGARRAGRMDPLNLVGAAKHGKADGDWDYSPVATKVKGQKLSEIGHGNIAPNPAHGGVTISSAQRIATISLAGLDRIGFGTASRAAAVAARAVLATYALMADRLAFGGGALWLRSGCELVVENEQVEWVHRGGGVEQFGVSVADSIGLFEAACSHAEKQGLPLSLDTVELTPSPNLAAAIDFSLTKAATEGE